MNATLLGSPIGDVSSISSSLYGKTQLLRKMGDRLQHLATQDAILLLRHSFAIPKLLYCLRTAPCFLSSMLQSYDDLLKSIVSTITNTHFSEDDLAWTQASLPVKFGGLGIRSAVHAACTFSLPGFCCCLLRPRPPHHPSTPPIPNLDDARAQWSQGHNLSLPEGSAQRHQKAWDTPKVAEIAVNLLENAPRC